MSSKTKIVVLRMKEIIYTAIFIGLGILLLLLLLAILIFFSHILLSPYKYRIYCCARISAFSLPNSPR